MPKTTKEIIEDWENNHGFLNDLWYSQPEVDRIGQENYEKGMDCGYGIYVDSNMNKILNQLQKEIIEFLLNKYPRPIVSTDIINIFDKFKSQSNLSSECISKDRNDKLSNPDELLNNSSESLDKSGRDTLSDVTCYDCGVILHELKDGFWCSNCARYKFKLRS